MKFGKSFEISKTLAAAALLGVMALGSGCTTMGRILDANYKPLGGKVVRLKVYQYGFRYTETESADVAHKRVDGMPWLGVYDAVPPTADRILPYRWVYVVAPGGWDAVSFWDNGPQGFVPVQVADDVPLLHEGDWVDVYTPESPLSVGKHRWLTVVKLVCRYDDKVCQGQDPVGRAKGQLVPGTSYSMDAISITPHYDMAGNWLPGKQPARP